ncbi:MAG: hypothetical protein KDD51_14135 [Bdellovibrionales bacterium]|nr:hypothetical protein [Bdellovibrionales bacterium]
MGTFVKILLLSLPALVSASQYYPNQPKWQKSITGIRLFDILEHEVTDNSTQLAVRAVTCSPPIPAEDFLKQTQNTNKKSEPTFPVGIDFVQSRGREIKDVFKVIRGSVTGNLILDRFLPSFGYQFKVQNMNDGVRTLFGARADIIIAAYYPENSTLYYNQSGEVGRAAVALVHEMVHALDSESHHAVKQIEQKKAVFHREMLRVVSSAKQRARKQAWDLHLEDYTSGELSYLKDLKVEIDQMEAIRSYRTERLAYDISYKAWQELARLYPEYYLPQRPKRRLARRQSNAFEPANFTDPELIQALGLNASVIRRFLSGACKRSASSH